VIDTASAEDEPLPEFSREQGLPLKIDVAPFPTSPPRAFNKDYFA
jgi:hypothetical protein